jgi:hypothetical protein
MARFTLKNAVAHLDGAALAGLRQIDIEESVSETDLTAAGDAWQDHETGIPSWTASLTFLQDEAAASNQTLRAGDVVTFSGYLEGNAAGKTFYGGTVSVLTHKVGGSYDGEATREYSCKGKGALTVDVVA